MATRSKFRIAAHTVGCFIALGAWACSSDDRGAASPADAGADSTNAATGGSQGAGTGGAKATGGRTSNTGGARVGSGGTTANTGGRAASGGTSTGGVSTGGAAAGGAPIDAGSGGGGPQDPACAAADGDGFFPDCTACVDPTNCDGIDTGGGVRQTCGCSGSSDCPCGLRCDCYTIAPGVRTCGICVR